MRLLAAFLIMLAFPLALKIDRPIKKIKTFCVPGMGYCMEYNSRIFDRPKRDVDNYGAQVASEKYEISGVFVAGVDAIQVSFEEYYQNLMAELEKSSPTLEEKSTTITDDYFYLTVESDAVIHFYQAWRQNDRLVKLNLQAPKEIDPAIWTRAITDFRVQWR